MVTRKILIDIDDDSDPGDDALREILPPGKLTMDFS